MSYYIFTVNDIVMAEKKINAEEIVESLLKNKIWFFNSNTPLHSKLKYGDCIMVYVCGHGRRYFVCKFKIESNIKNIEENIKAINLRNEVNLSWFNLYIEINNIEIFKNKVEIKPIIEELSFIKNKNNYGLNLRLPIVRLQDQDFKLIKELGQS